MLIAPQITMSFTTTLPIDISLPDEIWLQARVRKHGSALEINADDNLGSTAVGHPVPPATSFDTWLARAAGSSMAGLSTDQIMAMTRGEN